MAGGTARKCARCGSPLEANFRFCPGCALPAAGGAVLSTEIAEKRREAERRVRKTEGWQRGALVAGVGAMVAFVAGLGFVLFDRDLLDRVLETARIGEAEALPDRRPWEPEWCRIPAGRFLSGAPDEAPEEATCEEPFEISRHEVPNRLWEQFVLERGPALRQRGIYEDAVPRGDAGWELGADGIARARPQDWDYPVRDVTPLAAALFCEWLTARLDQPGVEIRLPTRLEWEYAARGPKGTVYPWGDEFLLPPPERTGASRPRPPRNVGVVSPSPVGSVLDDTSAAFGVVAMGTNVAEMAISSAPLGGKRLSDLIENRIVIVTRVGASYANTVEEAEVYARAWDTGSRDLDARTRFASVGLRLVKTRRY